MKFAKTKICQLNTAKNNFLWTMKENETRF